MSIDKNLDLITSQHRTKPKFLAWISTPLNILESIGDSAENIITAFDIDVAIGIQLDILGEIIGRKRLLTFQPSGGHSPLLDDETNRLILKAKIAQNQWGGTIPQIYEMWLTIFPNYRLIIKDNQDMSMNVAVVGISNTFHQELIQNGYIVPKPFGVSISYSFAQFYLFGYEIYDNSIRGYDEGAWV